VANIPIQTGSPDPVEVTDEHRRTSIEVMDRLSKEASSERAVARSLHVRIGHIEESGFLNPRLYGFWVLPVLPGTDDIPPMPGLDRVGAEWAYEQLAEYADPTELAELIDVPGAILQSPDASSEERPSLWACRLNSSIEAQIESTLAALATLISRQELVSQTRRPEIETLDLAAARVDDETTKLVGDEVRLSGWLIAARSIRARASAAGCSLHVTYGNPLLEPAAIRERMPLTRHIYNTLRPARLAIDATVSAMTQGWSISGRAPAKHLQASRDLIESSGLTTLLAHCARDAFVCGVGVLSLESFPLKDPWLLRPEDVESAGADVAYRRSERGIEKVEPIISMKGCHQISADTGISLLEPLMMNASKRDLFLRTLMNARIVLKIETGLPEGIYEWAKEHEPFALRQLAEIADAAQVFNPAALRLAEPVQNLYTPGMEKMAPATTRIALAVQGRPK
jgi:hypothetical protein